MKPQQYELIHDYLEDVKNFLLHVVPNNKDFLCALQQDLYEYVTSHPGCTKDDLLEAFGPPELIAKQQIETLEQKDIMKALKKRKITIIAIVVLICIVIIGGYYIFYLSYLSQGTGTISLEVEESGYIDDSIFGN